MKHDVIIPSVGESVTEAILAEWYKADGDVVNQDEPLLVIETDKVTLDVAAEVAGRLSIATPAGETVPIGAVVGTIDTAAAEAVAAATPAQDAAPPAADEPDAPPAEAASPAAPAPETPQPEAAPPEGQSAGLPPMSPSVRRLVAAHQLDVTRITGTGPGGRITQGDVERSLEQAAVPPRSAEPAAAEPAAPALEERRAMTPIRQRIAERLLFARQNTAMLTTFNEIDMARVMDLRSQYKERFAQQHGVALGFMSFFIKASVEALKEVPQINAFVDGNDIVYHHYYNIGVAIGSGKGLVVPVIRHAERLSFADLEQAIVDYVDKIKANRLDLADLEGGTFTISNGGVYGSLLSTPILNTPQSGILGMHKIEKRPVVVDDQIVIRPMMYVALSYDHRIVDGREAVTCLKRIKAYIENPERMMLEI